ncbi:MAG: Gfo/Idh/MocA family oxidoreductase [Chloroflexi bacterium]|nr:Gfo/Idh/MocA family oxidoreductase [Chloroflexota bacterium]
MNNEPHRPLRSALIGAGDMGSMHALVWQLLQDTALVSVFDVDRRRAEGLAASLGIPHVADTMEEAIARPDVDAVLIAVPAYHHLEPTLLAARHGKHIFCEKPIALTLEQADAMIAAARAAGVRLTVGLQRRHLALQRRLRDLIAEGALGRPIVAHYFDALEIRPKRAMHDLARGNGGPIIDQCGHYFDQWRMLFNAEPVRVTARGVSFGQGRPELAHIQEVAPDTASIMVEHDSGDLGTLFITWGLAPGVNVVREECRLFGPKGAVRFTGDMGLEWAREGGQVERLFCDEFHLEAEAKAWVASLREGVAPVVTPEDARRALEVSWAAIESLRTGRTVEL